MATDVEITDPKLSVFVPVPHAAAADVCAVCHGPTLERPSGGFYPDCWNCRGVALRTIVPISLVHTSESQLYASRRDYKKATLPVSVRGEHTLLLAATLQRFLRVHRPHIEAVGAVAWDTIQVVPSTRDRPGSHPLEEVVTMTMFRRELARLLTPTGALIDHNQPNPAAFTASAQANRRAVLLVDNTFTTGARVQSAAAALRTAGARVIGAVPIGRVVDTDHETKHAFWRRQRGLEFDFGVCCLDP
jgi:hypothetical protein